MKRTIAIAALGLLACGPGSTSPQANRPPVMQAPPQLSVPEGALLSFIVTATDPDGDDLTLGVEHLPDGAQFNTVTGQVSWTPDFTQSGTYTVTFTASDGEFTVSAAVEIAVGDVDRRPTIDAPAAVDVNEGQPLSTQITVADADGDALTTTAVVPQGAHFDPATLVLDWTPDFDQAGVYQVLFETTEQSGAKLFAQREMLITVHDVNRPPALDAPDEVAGTELQPISFDVSTTDPDGDVVDVAMTVAPDGASFDASQRRFTWTPARGQAGNSSVTFRATDHHQPDAPLSTFRSVRLTVAAANHPPTLEAIADQTVFETQTLEVLLLGHDEDADQVLTYSALGLPLGATLDGATFSWTPGCTAAGNYTVALSVSDGQASASQLMNIEVLDTNCPPRITAVTGPTTVHEGEQLVLVVSAEDDDVEGFAFAFASPGCPARRQARRWTPRRACSAGRQATATRAHIRSSSP
jgi:hypothetical protein